MSYVFIFFHYSSTTGHQHRSWKGCWFGGCHSWQHRNRQNQGWDGINRAGAHTTAAEAGRVRTATIQGNLSPIIISYSIFLPFISAIYFWFDWLISVDIILTFKLMLFTSRSLHWSALLCGSSILDISMILSMEAPGSVALSTTSRLLWPWLLQLFLKVSWRATRMQPCPYHDLLVAARGCWDSWFWKILLIGLFSNSSWYRDKGYYFNHLTKEINMNGCLHFFL